MFFDKNHHIDAFSSSVLHLEAVFGETALGGASSFVVNFARQDYLITNWHVVSGRNFETKKPFASHGGVPDRLVLSIPRSERSDPPVELRIELYDEKCSPVWLVHKERGSDVDVIAIPIDLPQDGHFFRVNEIKTLALIQRIGGQVFILGYPFGRGRLSMPVWKRGSFASEPSLSPRFEDYMLVDSASRPGMSGGLVIQREHGWVWLETGESGQADNGSARVVGIYSGRKHTSDRSEAQIGLVWPIEWVRDIVEGGMKDRSISRP